MPDPENALDTGYFQSRYSSNLSDEQRFPTNGNGISSDGDSLSCSSGCLSNHNNEGVISADPLSFILRNIGVKFRFVMYLNWINDGMQVDERDELAKFDTTVYGNHLFDNFSLKVLYHDFPPKIPCHPSIRLIIVLYSCRSFLANFISCKLCSSYS